MNRSLMSVVGLLVLLSASSVALAQTCPTGARYATNGDDLAFCIYENLTLPTDAQAYCSYVNDGYVGFSWPTSADSNYTCPANSYLSTNGAGTSFCIFSSTGAPAWATSYCNYLSDGYLGYQWRICPAGGYLTSNGVSEFCIFDISTLPVDASANCNSLTTTGSFGFDFPLWLGHIPLNRSYECPAGFTQTAGACTISNISNPSQLAPYCQYLSDGYIGYSWPL